MSDKQEKKENMVKNEKLEEIKELGAKLPEQPSAPSRIQVFTIIGQIEGHNVQPPQTKTTKYEHMIPQLIDIEQHDKIKS